MADVNKNVDSAPLADLEKEIENLSYEEALRRLEDVVNKLETADVSLDKSLELFQQGVILSRACTARLDAIERKITQLIENPDGTVSEEPFSDEP